MIACNTYCGTRRAVQVYIMLLTEWSARVEETRMRRNNSMLKLQGDPPSACLDCQKAFTQSELPL